MLIRITSSFAINTAHIEAIEIEGQTATLFFVSGSERSFFMEDPAHWLNVARKITAAINGEKDG